VQRDIAASPPHAPPDGARPAVPHNARTQTHTRTERAKRRWATCVWGGDGRETEAVTETHTGAQERAHFWGRGLRGGVQRRLAQPPRPQQDTGNACPSSWQAGRSGPCFFFFFFGRTARPSHTRCSRSGGGPTPPAWPLFPLPRARTRHQRRRDPPHQPRPPTCLSPSCRRGKWPPACSGRPWCFFWSVGERAGERERGGGFDGAGRDQSACETKGSKIFFIFFFQKHTQKK
jgi:hypothetical protein